MGTLLSVAAKTAMGIGMRLLSEKLIEEIILWGLKKLALSSKTKIDDELYQMVEKALEED